MRHPGRAWVQPRLQMCSEAVPTLPATWTSCLTLRPTYVQSREACRERTATLLAMLVRAL